MNKIKSIEKFLIKHTSLIIGLIFIAGWYFTFMNIVDKYGNLSVVYDVTECISLAIFGMLYILLSNLENKGVVEK
jgi:hypothetical protein